MMTELHPTIHDIPMPPRIAVLPRTENGFPVLFFAGEVDGKPDLRVVDGRKFVRCVKEKLCWLCGQKLGRTMAFVIGPMCTVSRTTAEPPSHHECAQYAVKACPFLTRPRAHRREIGIPEEETMAGCGLKRNPGVSAIWVTRSYRIWSPGEGTLITVGDPERVEWWAEGRQATYSEVAESIESGAPALFELCEKDRDPAAARAELVQELGRVLPLFQGLPGRDARTAEDAQLNTPALLAVRADELAWFAAHPQENEYVRPVRPGECPEGQEPVPTHVQVTKITENLRARAFGIIQSGVFQQSMDAR